MEMPMMHHHSPKIIVFPMGMIFTVMVSLMLTWKIARSLKIMAMTMALDKMGERLSEEERAELEGRIRHKLFERHCCCGGCHHM